MASLVDTFLVWFIIILAGLFAIVLISTPTVIAYLVKRWLLTKGYNFIGITLMIIAPILTVYLVYTAFFPRNSYYLDEFKEVTLRQAPKTAKIIRKSASYPDFHGDYCSASIIRLTREDYIDLLIELSDDNRLTKNGKLIGSSKLDQVMGTFKMEQIKCNFIREIPGEKDHYLYIGFLDDNETIIIYVSVT
jgi:hypothetical protein